jgi:hypothetical protein
MPNLTEGTYALGALTALFLWLFVGLPFLYPSREAPQAPLFTVGWWYVVGAAALVGAGWLLGRVGAGRSLGLSRIPWRGALGTAERGLARRLFVLIGPVLLTALVKATIAFATGGEEYKLYDENPLKLADLSIDLLLAAFAVLVGVQAYKLKSGTPVTVEGKEIKSKDIVICAAIQIAALILIFASVVLLPKVPFIQQNWKNLATIGLPDFIGFVAFGWVIVKLT